MAKQGSRSKAPRPVEYRSRINANTAANKRRRIRRAEEIRAASRPHQYQTTGLARGERIHNVGGEKR